MRFKVDENLPVEIAEELEAAGHDTLTVSAQHMQGEPDSSLAGVCQTENRVLVTLDLDFADIRTYPPEDYPGLIVLRVVKQDKHHVIHVFDSVIQLLDHEPLPKHLWIVEERGVRIRSGNAPRDEK